MARTIVDGRPVELRDRPLRQFACSRFASAPATGGDRRLRHRERAIVGRDGIVRKVRAFARRNREGRFRLADRRPFREVAVDERFAHDEIVGGDVIRRQPQRRAIVDFCKITGCHRHRTRRDRHRRPIRTGVVAVRRDGVPDGCGLADIRHPETFDVRTGLCISVLDFRIRDARHLDIDSVPQTVIHARIAVDRDTADWDIMRGDDKRRRQRLANRPTGLQCRVRKDVRAAFHRLPAVHTLGGCTVYERRAV